MRNRIEPTRELLTTLRDAQLAHAAALCMTDHHTYSDDGYDYLKSALALAQRMLEITYDDDLTTLDAMLNTDPDHDDMNHALLNDYACDGIANAFYELKPIALDDGSDD